MLAVLSAAAVGWHVSRDASAAVHKKEGKSYRQGKAKPFFQVSLSPSKSYVFGGGGGNLSLLTGVLFLAVMCPCVLHLCVNFQLE